MKLIIPFSFFTLFFIYGAKSLYAQTSTTTSTSSSTTNQFEKDAMIQGIRQENLKKFQDSQSSMSEMDILHSGLKQLEKDDSGDGMNYSDESYQPETAKDDYLKEHWEIKENKKLKSDFAPPKTTEKYQTPEF